MGLFRRYLWKFFQGFTEPLVIGARLFYDARQVIWQKFLKTFVLNANASSRFVVLRELEFCGDLAKSCQFSGSWLFKLLYG